MRNAHTAEPRSDDSSMRRIELPSVCPKPRSSGCKRNSATFVLSSRLVASTSCGRTSPRRSIVVGMCEILGLTGNRPGIALPRPSHAVGSNGGEGSDLSLLAVQLDDQLLLRRDRNVRTR